MTDIYQKLGVTGHANMITKWDVPIILIIVIHIIFTKSPAGGMVKTKSDNK